MEQPPADDAVTQRTPSVGDIVALWRARRLNLRDLPSSVAVPVAAVLVLVVATALLLVSFASDVPLPGGYLEVPSFTGGAPEVTPWLLVAFLWVALAVLSAAALELAARDDAKRPRLILVAVGLVMFTFLGDLINAGDTLLRYDTFSLVNGSLAIWRVFAAAGWAGLAAAVVISAMPLRLLRSNRALPAALGAAPYVLGLIAFVAAGSVGYRLPGSDGVLRVDALAARPFIDNGQILSYGLVLVVFWQAATWATAGPRLIGMRFSDLTRRWQWVFWFLVVIKLATLATGYLAADGCHAEGAFAASLCDGPAGWLIAAAIAAVIVAWVLWPRRWPITAERLPLVAAAIVFGFAVVDIGLLVLRPAATLAGLIQIGGSVDHGPFPDCLGPALAGGPTAMVGCATIALEPLIQYGPFATVALAVVGGILLLTRRRGVAAALGLPLIVFGIWASPRALETFLLTVLKVPDADVPHLGMQLVTFDTVLTILLAVAAVAALARHQRRELPPSLTLVLVVSTLMAHGSTLIPSSWTAALFVIMLPVPLLYVLSIDAGALNDRGPGRPTAVLRFMVVGGALLILATAAVALNTITPGDDVFQQLATLLFLVPFAVIVVGSLITEMTSRSSEAGP